LLRSLSYGIKPKIAACVVATANNVSAQEGEVEEVIITGMRAAAERAMDIKRDAAGVVDAISAEDIGKMPDANLAESLQRIPGVSISRTNGEGAQVTVRGIDPQKNMVTLNGRVMPAVTSDGTAGDKSSRAFDFANLASEGVAGVEVYKTGKANISGGGLGASINLKTLRPLDGSGSKASVGVKAVQDETVFRSPEGDTFTPEVSGVYSWANEDDTFGVAITASYQERDNSRSSAFVNNWQLKTAGAATTGTTDGTLPSTADVTNAPAAGSLYALPTDLRFVVEDNHRERTNGMLTFQYRPVERLTATVDFMYSEYDLSADRSQQSTWYNIDKIDRLVFDQGAEVATPLIYSEAYPDGGKDVSFAQQKFSSVSENNSFGINLAWDVTDSLTLSFDYHDSSAENETNQLEAGLNANVVTSEYSDWSRDFPVMGITFNDEDPTKGNDNGILDGGDVSGAMGTAAFDTQRTAIEQFQFKGDLDLGGFAFFDESSFQFGYEERVDTNSTFVNKGESPRIIMGNWGGVDPDTFGSDWPSYFTTRDFGEAFPDYGATTGDSRFLNYGLDGNFDKIIENLEWVYASGVDPDNFQNFPNGKFQASENFDVNRSLQEDVMSVFVQFAGSFEISGMASNIVLGLRHEETDLTSRSLVKTPANQSWDGDNDLSLVPGIAPPDTYTGTNSYDNLLPNIDFDISVMEDLKLRTSFSKTMARPGYDELKADTTIDNQYLRQTSSGTPELIALESQNFDLSAEWYYGDASFVSVGYFQKEVSNFIGNIVVDAEAYGLRDPRAGARFDQAIADITAAGGNPNSEEAQHNQMLINAGLDPNDESTSILADETDPIQIWKNTKPDNFQEDTIDGLEISVQHWFGDSGFGVQANYTAVDSGLNFDNKSDDEQFAMIGLSDTANLVAFYENFGLQARLAYNWRDSFLIDTAQGGNNAPGYIDEYSQLDFSISYELNDNVTISAEGLNITGENYRRYGRSERQMFELEDLGARYALGIRYAFQ